MTHSEVDLHVLAQRLVGSDRRLAVAESCTGGWLAKRCTDLAGSSDWFECGLVTYSNRAKQGLLGVQSASLDQFGAVSEVVAAEMVEGMFRVSAADLAMSITGIAGPDGGSDQKPVGTVWFAWAWRGDKPSTERVRFMGDRASVRRQAVEWALSTLARLAGA